jgi:hypothetical protein
MPRLTISEWAELEQDYRTGAFSVRELGRRYRVSDTAVRKRAKREGWKQDLRKQLNREVKRQLVVADSSQSSVDEGKRSQPPTREDDEATVSRAASVVVDKINHHRRMTKAQARGIEGLQAQINSVLDKAKGQQLMAGDLKDLAQAQRQVSSATLNMINCDRKSYNMDDQLGDENMPSAIKITFYREAPLKLADDG